MMRNSVGGLLLSVEDANNISGGACIVARRSGVSKRKRTAVSEEIRKLMREWKRTRKMTTSRATYRPKTKQQALKQAAAIAYGKHGLGRAGARKRRKKR